MPRTWSKIWMPWLYAVVALFNTHCISTGTTSADWSGYRGNAQRTSYSEQSIPTGQWMVAWNTELLARPEAAWPAPARGSLWQNLEQIEPRLTSDAGLVPIVAKSLSGRWLVLVASTTDNSLVAWDAMSGQQAWELRLEAPVRFAPEVHSGIAYFGADDGLVRAVSLDKGQLLWSVRIGPDLPWIYGNGKLISPHPIRTSVLLHDEKLLVHAGLFPSQGVYSAALNPADGRLLWRKRIEQSPQGYLLVEPDGERFFVPTGRAKPYMAAVEDGSWLAELPSPGGDFCIVTEQAYLVGPGNTKEMVAYSSTSNSEMLTLGGGAIAVGGGMVWTANGSQLRCQRLEAMSTTEVPAVWQVECDLEADMVVSQTANSKLIWVAGKTQIRVYDAVDGTLRQQLDLPPSTKQHASPEQISHLAISNVDGPGLLVATTSDGRVVAWTCGDLSRSEKATIADRPDRPASTEQGTESVGENEPKAVASVTAELQELIKAEVPTSRRGLACVVGEEQINWVRWLLEHSNLEIVWVHVTKPTQANSVAPYALATRRLLALNPSRVTLWNRAESRGLHIAHGLLNLLLIDEDCPWSEEILLKYATPGDGKLVDVAKRQVRVRDSLPGTGAWRHQYASPANTSVTEDQRVGGADFFRLQWFGGVGPSRIPDRHLRGPAPLAAGNSLVMHGDGLLIGVDPANGIERWQLELPVTAMRYVMPFDAAYTCLSKNGQRLYVAAAEELWTIDSVTGQHLDRRGVPPEAAGYQWGYVAEFSGEESGDETAGTIITTCMKPTAPRLSLSRSEARSNYSDQDYRSRRPLVCSRLLYSLGTDGSINWQYKPQGPIAHGTLAIDETGGRIVLVEGRSPACNEHATDRIGLSVLLEDAYLVCLDKASGKVIWEQKLQWAEAENVLFSQVAQRRLVLVSSRSVGDTAHYLVRVMDMSTGQAIWQTEHQHVRSGLYHGEQVHHPLLLERDAQTAWLIAEPYIYDLHTGRRQTPAGAAEDWSLQRPGHSCGTLTGAGNCLFFRADNPTVLDLDANGETRFIKLAPTRPSCWINMLPACGKLIIPEGSASCVCAYPLQTSMAFMPMEGDEANGLFWLPDVAAELKDTTK